MKKILIFKGKENVHELFFYIKNELLFVFQTRFAINIFQEGSIILNSNKNIYIAKTNYNSYFQDELKFTLQK